MENFIPAWIGNRPLLYSHIKISPGEDSVPTADPWSYLYSQLLQGTREQQGKNEKNLKRAIFYLGLAQNYYRASDAADLPAKATLLYYGMLNLVKVWLSTRGVELETLREHHGLTLPLGSTLVVGIHVPPKNSISIFAEFSEALGKPFEVQEPVSLHDAILQVPELYSTRRSSSQEAKQNFLHVDIQFLTDPDHGKLVTTLNYNKRDEDSVESGKIYQGARKEYFEEPIADGERVRLLSKRVRRPASLKNSSVQYRKILKEYDEFDLCTLLTRKGYRYYINLEPGPYHHLAYTFLILYYLGTAARYRPMAMDQILDGDLRQSVTEACAICPRQFLYQLTCHITKSVCVVPDAEI